MAAHDKRPLRIWRTGTEQLTIIEAHPYHYPVGRIGHKGAGQYERGYKAECPLCHAEEQPTDPPPVAPARFRHAAFAWSSA